MKSLDTFEETVSRYPDEPAIKTPCGTTISYSALDERSTALASWLVNAIGAGRTASLVANSAPALDIVLAAQKRGAADTALNTRVTPQEQAWMLDNSDAECLIFDDEHRKTAEQVLQHTSTDVAIHVGSDGAGDAISYEEVLARDPEEFNVGGDEFGIFYTSGTTGRPKGVLVDQRRAWMAQTQANMEMQIGPDDVALLLSPLFHVVTPISWVMPHFQSGAALVPQRNFDPVETLELVEAFEITGLFGVPTQLKMLVEAQREHEFDLSRLRLIRSGGAPLPATTVSAVHEHLTDTLYNTYGISEGVGNITYAPVSAQHESPGTIGRASYNWKVRVVEAAEPGADPDPAAIVDRGETGEIIARGPSMVDGYLDRPEATERLYVNGWLRTGDMAHVDQGGNLSIVDRIDNMIVSGGENIYPKEVENVLEAHPAVEATCVIGVADEKWGTAVKAIVVGEGVTADDLDRFCKEHPEIADFKRPRHYDFTDSLPRSPLGKLRRGLIEERCGEPTDATEP